MPSQFKIIAETAFSHEGDFDYLLAQIDEAVLGEVDYIKFQVLIDKDYCTVKTAKSYDSLDQWILTADQWLEAFEYSKSKKLGVVALPLDTHSLEFCMKHDELTDIYEVHSVSFNEYPLLNMLKQVNKKILLGIGGRLPGEVEYALNIMGKGSDDVLLMFGFQSFPTQKEMLNLGKISNFGSQFNCIMGYADHCGHDDDSYHSLNQHAYLLGARYFEKHIVVKKGLKRIDYDSAIDAGDFVTMRKSLSELQIVLGNGELSEMNDKELVYKSREKQIVAVRDIAQGESLQIADIVYRFTDEVSDFDQQAFSDLVGKKLLKGIEADQTLKKEHLDL